MTRPAGPELKDLSPDPENARRISDEASWALRQSLAIYGDLAGIVYNRATGHLICAHRRREELLDLDIGCIRWGKPYTVTLGYSRRRFESKERDGWLRLPDGARFRIREVEWEPEFERAANLVANSAFVAGEFTDQAAVQLRELRETISALAMDDLQLHELLEELTDDAKPESDLPEQDVPEVFQVVIECESEADQHKLYERLVAEGLACHLLVL